jgi:hypothetical protein
MRPCKQNDHNVIKHPSLALPLLLFRGASFAIGACCEAKWADRIIGTNGRSVPEEST